MLGAVVAFIILLAVLDLWVGVTNDAVNFLNSAIGARVASRRVILGIAAAGVFFGAFVSNGMMEIARKGIFNPDIFVDAAGALNLGAILAVYLGVMAADVIMLDLFNTLGLPTSTTVSIISELVGASIAVVFWMSGGDLRAALAVINAGPVLAIYSGIFLSVVIAFSVSAAAMFGLRLLFTRDLAKTFPYVGWMWSAAAFCSISYFVLFKGLKNASFLSAGALELLHANILAIMGGVAAAAALAAFVLAKRHELMFKAIILFGTCALAIAFAGNDLVNFIGPSVAAAQAVFLEGVELSGGVPTPGWALAAAGLVMVLSLWTSRKAKTVTDTEVRLAAHGATRQRFQSTRLARAIVRAAETVGQGLRLLTPASLRHGLERRTAAAEAPDDNAPPYDLLRASVNLTVASLLISIGTANKLPLSTTYITFMAAMGASLADGSWSRDSADSRVTGILAVLGGWVVTGFIAALAAFAIASLAYLSTTISAFGPLIGLALIGAIVVLSLMMLGRSHRVQLGTRATVVDEL